VFWAPVCINWIQRKVIPYIDDIGSIDGENCLAARGKLTAWSLCVSLRKMRSPFQLFINSRGRGTRGRGTYTQRGRGKKEGHTPYSQIRSGFTHFMSFRRKIFLRLSQVGVVRRISLIVFAAGKTAHGNFFQILWSELTRIFGRG